MNLYKTNHLSTIEGENMEKYYIVENEKVLATIEKYKKRFS